MTESSGPDSAFASQEAEMAVGETADFGCLFEGDEIAQVGCGFGLVVWHQR